jgi:hypothetical protein
MLRVEDLDAGLVAGVGDGEVTGGIPSNDLLQEGHPNPLLARLTAVAFSVSYEQRALMQPTTISKALSQEGHPNPLLVRLTAVAFSVSYEQRSLTHFLTGPIGLLGGTVAVDGLAGGFVAAIGLVGVGGGVVVLGMVLVDGILDLFLFLLSDMRPPTLAIMHIRIHIHIIAPIISPIDWHSLHGK